MSDTPKRWGEYLENIKAYNKSCDDMAAFNLELAYARWNEMPWYERIFHTNPKESIFYELEHLRVDKGPSLLDYYEWDVRTRKKKEETK
jgi:hypothetical protein